MKTFTHIKRVSFLQTRGPSQPWTVGTEVPLSVSQTIIQSQSGNHCDRSVRVCARYACNSDVYALVLSAGMLVVIGLGVAIGIVVGGVFLALALLYLKR